MVVDATEDTFLFFSAGGWRSGVSVKGSYDVVFLLHTWQYHLEGGFCLRPTQLK